MDLFVTVQKVATLCWQKLPNIEMNHALNCLILFQALNNSNSEHVYYIRAERDEFVLGLQMINPFHNYTTEELLIYDYRKIKQDPLIQVIANSQQKWISSK